MNNFPLLAYLSIWFFLVSQCATEDMSNNLGLMDFVTCKWILFLPVTCSMSKVCFSQEVFGRIQIAEVIYLQLTI